MADVALKINESPETDREIRQVLISHVENNVSLDLDAADGERYDNYCRVYHALCVSGLPEGVAQKWWDWGTREGFTII